MPKTIEIDISDHNTSKFELDIKHIIGGFSAIMVAMVGGLVMNSAPPIFGISAIDLYMAVGSVLVVVAFTAAIGSVHRIAKRDKKAHASFLSRFSAQSGLKFFDESALVVNNFGYTGVPRTVILTDGAKQSLWSPSVEGKTLKLTSL